MPVVPRTTEKSVWEKQNQQVVKESQRVKAQAEPLAGCNCSLLRWKDCRRSRFVGEGQEFSLG